MKACASAGGMSHVKASAAARSGRQGILLVGSAMSAGRYYPGAKVKAGMWCYAWDRALANGQLIMMRGRFDAGSDS